MTGGDFSGQRRLGSGLQNRRILTSQEEMANLIRIPTTMNNVVVVGMVLGQKRRRASKSGHVGILSALEEKLSTNESRLAIRQGQNKYVK